MTQKKQDIICFNYHSMIYFAPLEDVSGYIFRNLINDMFPGTDRYFTPFISAVSPGRKHKKRETEDVSPENNARLDLVPQILTNRSEDFLYTVEWLINKGYKELNFNLGCPSRDVVVRGKGSGFLARPDKLDAFFEEIFTGLKDHADIKLSVKTRVGSSDNKALAQLIAIFNRYPIAEVTVHPRLGKDFYRGRPDMESFGMFYEELNKPLVYNGDITTCEDIQAIKSEYPKLKAVMIGRGFLKNPALAREYKGGEALTIEELDRFVQRLYKAYRDNLSADKYALDKMKELWGWLKESPMFEDKQRRIRAVLKAGSCAEYDSAVLQIFK